jgi:hypothetical protein
MHTIDDCPRCGKDFMYHQNDKHLRREESLSDQDLITEENRDNSKGGWCGYIIICQDCDEIENIAEFIKEKAVHRGWENAEYLAAEKYGEDKTLKAMQWIDKNLTNNQNDSASGK